MRILLLTLAIALMGCSTHDPRYDPPTGTSTAAGVDAPGLAADGSLRIIDRYRQTGGLPTRALANLAWAAATLPRANHPERLDALVSNLGNDLLARDALVIARPGAGELAASANAFTALYERTGEARYERAGLRAARRLATPRAGWVTIAGERGIRADQVRRGLDLGATATAAGAFERVHRELDGPFADAAGAAFATVLAHQAALGRWWAYTAGPKEPTTLLQWSAILEALSKSGVERRQAIAGGGVPAMAAATFDDDGAIRDAPRLELDALGIATSLRALQSFAVGRYAVDPKYALRAFSTLVFKGQRDDGTVEFADAGDANAQSTVAVALAERARDLLRP